MEKRKLIRFGKSSYVITLPSSWVRSAGLKKGDDVFVSERDREIIVSARAVEKSGLREYSIHAASKSLKEIETEIVSAYLNNYDVIRVFEKPLLRNASEIKGIIRNLAGLEILEQTKTKMVAKDLIDIRELSIEALIRRMDVITRSIFDDLLSGVRKRESPPYLSIRQRDQDVNRLVFLSFRVLRRALRDPAVRNHMNITVLEAHKYYMIVLRVEKIDDFSKRMARNLQDCIRSAGAKKGWWSGLHATLSETVGAYADVMASLFRHDSKSAFKVEVGSQARIDSCNRLLGKSPGVAAIEVVENLKNMNASVRHIARSVIGLEGIRSEHGL